WIVFPGVPRASLTVRGAGFWRRPHSQHEGIRKAPWLHARKFELGAPGCHKITSRFEGSNEFFEAIRLRATLGLALIGAVHQPASFPESACFYCFTNTVFLVLEELCKKERSDFGIIG